MGGSILTQSRKVLQNEKNYKVKKKSVCTVCIKIHMWAIQFMIKFFSI